MPNLHLDSAHRSARAPLLSLSPVGPEMYRYRRHSRRRIGGALTDVRAQALVRQRLASASPGMPPRLAASGGDSARAQCCARLQLVRLLGRAKTVTNGALTIVGGDLNTLPDRPADLELLKRFACPCLT
jgi:hypothetical protein